MCYDRGVGIGSFAISGPKLVENERSVDHAGMEGDCFHPCGMNAPGWVFARSRATTSQVQAKLAIFGHQNVKILVLVGA